MSFIQLQMIDCELDNSWWREVFRQMVQIGDPFEIRCWNNENAEIQQALKYGERYKDGSRTEISVRGTVSAEMIHDFLCAPEPLDQNLYHKMISFFTVRINAPGRELSSEHYGTEYYVIADAEHTEQFLALLKPYQEHFSMCVDADTVESL